MKLREILVLMPLAALASCTRGDAQQKPAAPAAVTVSAIKVAPRAVPVEFESVGRTEGSREVQVRARVSGILEQQLYTEGDAVEAGAPLFRIERAPFAIELAQARAARAQERARSRSSSGCRGSPTGAPSARGKPTRPPRRSSRALPRCRCRRRACARPSSIFRTPR
jgi:multidrug efflux pump subunit AcrA (membrane-fusion protein)